MHLWNKRDKGLHSEEAHNLSSMGPILSAPMALDGSREDKML